MYYQPATVDQAVTLLSTTDAAILAGGTDFYPALGDRPLRRAVLDISAIAGLRAIRRDGGVWRLPANATWTDLRRTPLPPLFDGLVAAARELGSVQIQNAATIVGNLCNASPAADGVPCLLAMDAQIEIAGGAGTRVLPLDEFILGPRRTALEPGEMVTAILVPDAEPGARSAFQKLGARRYLVISIVSVAAVLHVADGTITSARIAVGACSAVPRRLEAMEAALLGAAADPAAALARIEPDHLAAIAPIDDVRGTAAYRLDSARTLIARALSAVLPERTPS